MSSPQPSPEPDSDRQDLVNNLLGAAVNVSRTVDLLHLLAAHAAAAGDQTAPADIAEAITLTVRARTQLIAQANQLTDTRRVDRA